MAEVLITIGIIGVVAALTIPTLAHKLRNKVLEIQFKNTYAKVTQAVKRMQADMAMTDIGSYCTYWSGSSYANMSECSRAFRGAFNTGLIYQSDIKRTDISTFGSPDIKVRPLDNIGVIFDAQNKMNDGTYIGYRINSATFYITFDTNGEAKPNRFGYDIFLFYVTQDGKDKVEGFKPVNYSNTQVANYEKNLADSAYKDYWVSTYGSPCNYTSTQTSNGIGCGYYAIRNKCPDGSNKGYFECLK